MSDLTEAQQQAQAALEKVMNCRFNNFDAGAVIHWAERGFYQVKAEAASRISQQDAELERLRRELADVRDNLAEAEKDTHYWRVEYDKARKAAFIEAAEIADGYDETDTLTAPKHIAAELRAKAEETGR